MSSDHWAVSIDEELKKNPSLTREQINDVHDWLQQQQHLPNISDHSIIMFLHACKFNTERTKETIDLHFTYRTMMKDIFSNRDPDGEDVSKILQCCTSAVLPGTDKDGNYVVWANMYDPDLKKFKFASAGKLNIMTTDVLQLKHGTVPGVINVYDVKNMSLSHLLSTPITTLRHYVIYGQDASPFPVKGIHFVNTSPVMDKLMNLVKPIIKSSVWKIQFFHSNMESVYKHIPKDMVPEEYGGNAESLQKLTEKTIEDLKKYRSWFLEEEKIRVDETKRADKNKTAALTTLFKKLSMVFRTNENAPAGASPKETWDYINSLE